MLGATTKSQFGWCTLSQLKTQQTRSLRWRELMVALDRTSERRPIETSGTSAERNAERNECSLQKQPKAMRSEEQRSRILGGHRAPTGRGHRCPRPFFKLVPEYTDGIAARFDRAASHHNPHRVPS